MQHEKWYVKPAKNTDAIARLFIFPYAGASPSAFREWTKYIPPEIETLLIQLPGRGARLSEPSEKNISKIVKKFIPGIKDQLNKPIIFFGHSLGALIAFEVCRYLRNRGIIPIQLFVSGKTAPQLPYTNKLLHRLDDNAFIQQLRILEGIPEEAFDFPDLLDLALPVLRADFTVLETYTYSSAPKLECPITAYGGTNDPLVTINQLKAWQDQTIASFNISTFEGNHFYFNKPETGFYSFFSDHLHKIIAVQ